MKVLSTCCCIYFLNGTRIEIHYWKIIYGSREHNVSKYMRFIQYMYHECDEAIHYCQWNPMSCLGWHIMPRTLFSSLRSFRCARIIYYGILQCLCKVRSIKGIKITSGIIKLACAQPKKNNFGIEIWQFFSKSHLLSLVISLILEMTLVLIIYISKTLDKLSYSSLSFHLL